MLENLTDDALIQRYVQNNDTQAFDTLMLRHRDPVYWKFYKSNPADAEDLMQDLWLHLLQKLPHYKAQGKFTAYLSVLIKHTLIDHWKSKAQKTIENTISGLDDQTIPSLTHKQSPEQAIDIREQLKNIFHILIPKLPCEQRMAYLLTQESKLWEGTQKLSWQDIAIFNGIDPNEAYRRFLKTRDALLLKNPIDTIQCEDLLIFLLWTQCQRIDKKRKFTMAYFADLLGIATDTFKGRERQAKKKLVAWANG